MLGCPLQNDTPQERIPQTGRFTARSPNQPPKRGTLPHTSMEAPRTFLEDLVPFTGSAWELPAVSLRECTQAKDFLRNLSFPGVLGSALRKPRFFTRWGHPAPVFKSKDGGGLTQPPGEIRSSRQKQGGYFLLARDGWLNWVLNSFRGKQTSWAVQNSAHSADLGNGPRLLRRAS